MHVVNIFRGRMKRNGVNRIRLVAALLFAAFVLSCSGNARADFTFGEPTNLGPNINSATWDGGAAVSPDGLELYFYSFVEGFGIPTVRIAVRQSDQDPWGKAQNASWLPFSGTSVCFSADGLTLLYESFQAGGFGQTDIWMTARATLSDPWGPTVNLGSGVNSPYTDMGASLSPDGLELYFGSDRPGGSGDWDVYVSTRETIADPWGPAVNLGPTVNSPAYDGHPYIAPDGLTLFVTSARPGGCGDWDIWFTRRRNKESAWPALVNAGPALNTSVDEGDAYISFDGQTLYFSDGYSFRSGGVGGTDLWQVRIVPVVDLNGDSQVDGGDVLSMAAHWGQDYPACDIGPRLLETESWTSRICVFWPHTSACRLTIRRSSPTGVWTRRRAPSLMKASATTTPRSWAYPPGDRLTVRWTEHLSSVE